MLFDTLNNTNISKNLMIKLGLAIMAILIIGVSTNTVFGQSTNEDLESRIIELELENSILETEIDLLAYQIATLMDLTIEHGYQQYIINDNLDIISSQIAANDNQYYDLLDEYDLCSTDNECTQIDNRIYDNDNEYFDLVDQENSEYAKITPLVFNFWDSLNNWWNVENQRNVILDIAEN